jgi:hypothetical protein
MNNTVLHILSHDGSLEFKHQLANAENMSRLTTNVDHLNAIHDELYEKLDLLERESDNPAYTKHQIVTMETYIDKLNHTVELLQNRINEIMNSEARGVRRRKTKRRKTGRRKSVRRKSGRRKSRRSRY